MVDGLKYISLAGRLWLEKCRYYDNHERVSVVNEIFFILVVRLSDSLEIHLISTLRRKQADDKIKVQVQESTVTC